MCLLSGYAWLALGAALLLAAGALVPGSPSYDAALHALALLAFIAATVASVLRGRRSRPAATR